VEVTAKAVIGDDRDRLAEAVRAALSRSAIVILSGGAGADRRRCHAAKRWHWRLDRKLVFHPENRRADRSALRAYEAQDGGVNRRQAFVIEGADVLPTTAAPRPANGWRNRAWSSCCLARP